MKKVITVNNKDIVLVSSGATPFIYTNEFHTDFFKDLAKFMRGVMEIKDKSPELIADADDSEVKKIAEENPDMMNDMLDGDLMKLTYQFLWVYAKNGDTSTPGLIEFLGQFEEFPAFDVISDIIPFVMTTISTKKV